MFPSPVFFKKQAAAPTNFVFNQTISTETYAYNLRTAAIAAGWNGVLPLIATIIL